MSRYSFTLRKSSMRIVSASGFFVSAISSRPAKWWRNGLRFISSVYRSNASS